MKNLIPADSRRHSQIQHDGIPKPNMTVKCSSAVPTRNSPSTKSTIVTVTGCQPDTRMASILARHTGDGCKCMVDARQQISITSPSKRGLFLSWQGLVGTEIGPASSSDSRASFNRQVVLTRIHSVPRTNKPGLDCMSEPPCFDHARGLAGAGPCPGAVVKAPGPEAGFEKQRRIDEA